MNPETLFSLANYSVMPFWLLLIVAPRWRLAHAFLAPVLVALLLGLAYAICILPQIGSGDGGFGSLGEVRLAFDNDYVLLAGWIHYLAFDLFVGSWEVRDAQRVGIPHLAVVPCLALTFILGPIGLCLYLLLRLGWKRNWNLVAEASSSS